MDYENEFNDIINAVKSEIKAQKQVQNSQNSTSAVSFAEFIEHSNDELSADLDSDEIAQNLGDDDSLNFSEMNFNAPKSKAGANSDEVAFLSAVRERILVLFEGLNSFDSADIEARVELNLKFMEFLLASIENRLENLSK
ncbi:MULTISPECIES: CiaD-like domain-containing protein [unclassified Campylobacter]|uniref:CiaD-like domain-containing protein n=1 Tax=unclassified Campylobacter TaxID=2593542 RepID=UPI0022E99E40|nr:MULTISPECIES: hypothetical protein [unclassified Campylobacter]MDA3043456.1 hypothetical protein [Campylobacter sp. JMF_09 ED2]MDA3045210.1 hypothetical protein [Campylobacter sp. JMF_07 ED4]MDA3064190.1 hypothetical protein [Campylobacter sp. JMF_11 EL3]MDA3071938.1 hypothetical protein [Campylobacter sp. VBCF_03 NA9]MDA3075378.1 hypothetical protein [Campylobacter sp. JMF_05 ED3]